MTQPPVSTPRVLLFDVNETLLDLSELHESVDNVLLQNNGSKLWFSSVLHYSLVLTVSGQFRPFPEIGAAVLQMMATNRDVMLSDDDARKALEPMRRAGAHPDVLPALEALHRAGIRMATLTNSTADGARAQLDAAGIAQFLERQLSVESVGQYKPHREVYAWAAAQMQVAPEACMLVAAHPWDVAGAAWAGMRTAFLARLGVRPLPLAPDPDIECLDLGDLVKQLGVSA
jgi:2-haloacid dehalogenase